MADVAAADVTELERSMKQLHPEIETECVEPHVPTVPGKPR
jgi:hypothetical protein